MKRPRSCGSKAVLSGLQRKYSRQAAGLAPISLVCLCLLSTLAGCKPERSPELLQPPREITVSPEAAQRLTDLFTRAMSTHGSVRILIGEEEVTSYLFPSLQATAISDIRVWFTQETMCLTAQLDMCGQHTIGAILSVACRDGVLQACVRQATLDGQHLPRFVLASVEEAINDALADAQLSLRVRQVVLGEGFMLIMGTR